MNARQNIMVLIAGTLTACMASAASAQFLMVTDTDDDRVLLFDAFDGSLVDENFLLLDDLVETWSGSPFDSANTPVNAIQVGSEIWVSDSGEDSIFRVNSSGNVIGRIGGSSSDFMSTGGLDDIRGMDTFGNQVFVINDGTGNNAPGDDTMVILNATTGAFEGGFALRGEAEDVVVVGNELWVNNRDGNTSIGDGSDDTIDVYDLAGNYLRTVIDSDGSSQFDSAQQMSLSSNGLLVASESFPSGIFEYALDGSLLNSYLGGFSGVLPSGNILGVHELGNGNIMFTVNNDGAYSFNPSTGEIELLFGGIDALYIEAASIPAPGTLALAGLCGFAAVRRRR